MSAYFCNFTINLLLLFLYGFGIYYGNTICKFIILKSNIQKDPIIEENIEGDTKASVEKINDKIISIEAGWLIGILERSIVCIGILLRSWALIAGVVALKSISRYKELDKQINAEYFLVGSLISLLWAFIITFLYVYVTSIFMKYKIIDESFVEFIMNFQSAV